MPAIRHNFVTARGVRHHVAECGEGPPLLLLHGWPEFWATWEPMFARLGHRYRLIAPDFRGFGESDNPHPEPTDAVNASSLAEDVVALMDALDLGQAGIVGHDVGSNVMQVLGVRNPERATGLFFFNCATHGVGSRWNEPGHINQIWYQTLHQQPYAAALVASSRENCQRHIGHLLRHWSHRKNAFDAVMERWVDNFMRPGNMQGGFNWYIGQNVGRLAVMAGTAPKPPKITVPTRVFWGRHDPILKSEWADVLGEYFTDVELSFCEGAGHFVHYEQPDEAAMAVDAFFTRLAKA
ncbi:MAG: alpha/beta fold hydrolase [Beijerinckiaceae bacterium]